LTTHDTTLAERVAAIPWYHTFDFPGGLSTQGFFDLRGIPARLPIPPDLTGKRCLDVASADGFFAFEMARRGGDVVSFDLPDTTRQDWQGPPGVNDLRRQSTGRARQAFEVARDALGLDVERVDGSVYDISPELLGTFDFVFMGNILIHLSDPMRALHAVRSVTDGTFLSYESISMPLTLLRPMTPTGQLWHTDDARWWTPNWAAHRRLVEAGGFRVHERGRPMLMPLGAMHPRWPDTFPRRPRLLYHWTFVRQFGVATAWVLAQRRELDF
jgi:tRNA (mo5U34)-methyltransferase